MRIPIKLAAVSTACLLAAGCGTDSGSSGDQNQNKADAGATDGSSSGGGADGASSSDGADGAPSGGGGDTASAAKYKTCSELGDCVLKQCGAKAFADGCEKQCLSDSSDKALAAGAPLLSCVKEECVAKKCKGETGSAEKAKCINDCMPAACGPHMFGCLESGKDGAKPCGAVFGCLEGCDNAPEGPGFACWEGCYNSLDAGGKKGFKTLMKCAIDHGGFDSPDSEKACTKDMIACQVGGKWGEGTCRDTLQCMMACDSSAGGAPEPGPGGKQPGGEPGAGGGAADECNMKCLTEGSEAAFDGFMDLASSGCMGPGSEGGDPGCSDKILKCLDPQGTATCPATLSCVQDCVIAAQKAGGKDMGKAGAKCSFDCIAKAEPKGAKYFWGLMTTCLNEGPPPLPGGATPVDLGPTPMCVESVAKCTGAGAGTATCADLVTCSVACKGTDQKGPFDGVECGMGCAGKASQKGIEDFKKHAECAHHCAEKCATHKEPQACNAQCWADTQGCAAAKKACTPAG